jgi:hypothetical protein
MSNSFYYFFSATPQVLGGILALFGVFVIFKIQSLRNELITIGKTMISNVENYSDQSDGILSIQIKAHTTFAVNRNDLKGLKSAFDIFSNKNNYFYKEFYRVYSSYKSIIRRTIYLSVFTAFIIFLCLSVLPFGTFILCHAYLVYYLFFIVIDSIFICLFGLIYILIKSINESD